MTGKELKAARERLGWTQEELAEALQVHPMTISEWERGVVAIERRTKLAMASFKVWALDGSADAWCSRYWLLLGHLAAQENPDLPTTPKALAAGVRRDVEEARRVGFLNLKMPHVRDQGGE